MPMPCAISCVSDNVNAGSAITHTAGRRTSRITLNITIHLALRQNMQTSK